MKPSHKYDALRNLEENENHDDSSTEVESSDTEIQPRTRRKQSRFCKGLKRWRWVIDTALLLIIFGLLAEKRWKKHVKHKSHRYEFAGDLTGFAPKFSQQITTFKPDHRFAPENASAFWDGETQDAWLSIVPKGLGYVLVEDPERYDNLPHPIHDYPNKTVFTTSMTHQLHCLYTILDAYNTLLAYPNWEIELPWHVTHCFEYLRQAIMCAGDVALEGAETTFPDDPEEGDRGGSDGWDAKHVCKDYGEVIRYLEERAADEEKWI
ncbi:hypothetical protein K469DRAFT_732514 [Zopfia rhizophila CBS 207.26]|uniref:Uncharacterized protein n=1 Tax=Zopfia rhizophila CBS 207.26 TaxID=1314779 RepID=A0A6A6EJS0_9PEZI|nr:hypothetical protein K469DRAFT_732514 [Zopfia rhizophila CBS 207.26]